MILLSEKFNKMKNKIIDNKDDRRFQKKEENILRRLLMFNHTHLLPFLEFAAIWWFYFDFILAHFFPIGA